MPAENQSAPDDGHAAETPPRPDNPTSVDTGGGVYVEGDVNVGRDFIGRDQVNYHGYTFEQVLAIIEKAQQRAEVERPNPLLDFKLLHFEPPTVLIPAGPFRMGSNPGPGIANDETPSFVATLPDYRIGLAPVTNQEYAYFVAQTGRLVDAAMGWAGQKPATGSERLPVAGVTFADALTYCEWLSAQTQRPYALPNEAEWEKAARGIDSHLFPWGNEWEDGRCNQGGDVLSAVDAFPAQSGYGCFDLVGNVRQWTCTLWGSSFRAPEPAYAYPWQDDGRNDPAAGDHLRRVVRGAAHADEVDEHRCTARRSAAPDRPGVPGKRHGFRVVLRLGE